MYEGAKPTQNLVFDTSSKQWRPMPKYVVDPMGNLQTSGIFWDVTSIVRDVNTRITQINISSGSIAKTIDITRDGTGTITAISVT